MFCRILCFSLFFISNFIQAQGYQITGTISDSEGEPLNSASITLNISTDKIIVYDISDNFGNFKLTFKATEGDSLRLQARSLGYKEFTETIIASSQNSFKRNIQLEEKLESLDEVLVVESQKQMIFNKDTITYNLNFYSNKTEQTVEDILEKLPGIEVEDDGTIKYQNKEISKMLIDGDDLVDDQYTILSKNLDSDLLKNVQVLRNYDDNPLRKKFGEGDEVAINLSIKDDKKNIIFGKATLGGGTDNRYSMASNLGLLRKKFKILNLNEFNNTGNLVSPQTKYQKLPLQDLWNRNSKKESFAPNVVKNELNQPAFLQPEEAVRNKSEMASFTTSYKWNEDSSMRGLAYFAKDRINFDSNIQNIFLTGEAPVEYTETTGVTDISPTFYANAELKNYNQKNWYTTFETEIRNQKPVWNQNLFLNENPIRTLSNGRQTSFNNHLNLTYQASESLLWENYVYYSFSDSNQEFSGNGITFNEEEENSLYQFSNLQQEFFGLNSRLRLKNAKRTIKFKAGIENEADNFSSEIKFNEQNTPDSLKFDRNIKFLNIYNQLSYTFHFKNNKDLKFQTGITSKSPQENLNNYHLFQGGLSYSFPLKKMGRFAINYTFKQQLSQFSEFYPGFTLTNYRTLKNGANDLLKIGKKSFGLTHNYQGYDSGFLIFNLVSYNKYDKGYISRNFINTDFTVINIEEGNGGELLIAQNQLTKYIDIISTSLKFENGFNYFLNYLAANNEEILPAKNYNLTSSLTGTTYFKLPINLKFSLEYQNNQSLFNNQTTKVENFILSNTLTFKPNDILIFSANYNYYNLASNKHSFLSGTIDYKPKKSSWSFQFSAQNLLNVRNFSTSQTNDFRFFEQRTNIIPRYAMLTAHLRF